MKRFLVAALIILGAFLSPNIAYPAPDMVSSFVSDGYGRIVFNTAEGTNYKIKVNEENLEIFFSKEQNAALSSILSSLSGYIDNIEKSKDGKRIKIKMTRPYPVRDFKDKDNIVIDILGSPIEIPKNSKFNNSSDAVLIRTGYHDTFFRYVFDFKNVPKYSVSSNDNKVIVTFDKPFHFNKSELASKLPQELDASKISIKNDKDKTFLELPGSLKENFILSRSIVVDVFLNPKNASSSSIRPKTSPIGQVVKEKLANIAETKKANKNLKDKVKDKGKTPDEKLTVVSEPSKLLPMTHSRIVSLSFPWNMQTSLAAFKRAGYIWLIFNNKKTIDFTMMMRMSGDVIKDMVQIPHSKGTVVRILTYPSFSPSIRREGFLWIVDLVQQPIKPQSTIDVVPIHTSPEGAKLFMPVKDPSLMMSVVDPEIGDVIFVVPIFSLGRGIFPEMSYVDVDFLPTAQGIAIVPKNEGVYIRTSVNGVEVIMPPEGLSLSNDSDHLTALLMQDGKQKLSPNFNLARWYRGGVDKINYDTFTLNNLMALAPEDKKNLARLEAARYYIAHDLPADALGIIENIMKSDHKDVNPAALYAARGMANFLIQRYNEALVDFNHPSLVNDETAVLWRAATEASISEPEKQISYFKTANTVLKTYPQPVRNKLATIAVKAALAAEDDGAAQNFLELSYNDQGLPMEKAEHVYYIAKWEAMTGSYRPAISDYSNVIWYGGSRKYSAYALKEKTKLELEIKKIKIKDAIKIYEDLVMDWRGDDFEYEVLSTLTDFYIEDKDYKQAFDTLKRAYVSFKNSKYSDPIKSRMQKIFEDLFISGKADDMSPIKALAIFEDHKNLIPEGDIGNELINKLTDRLVAVDLLDRAASLLDNMIKKRAKDDEKAVFGAKLALIRLLDKKPQDAIKSLDETNVDNIPPLLAMRRRHLRARALSDMNKTNEAIALLNGDETEDGVLLRAEIYWHNNDWNNAADTIKLLIEKPSKDKPMTDEQARRILDWATALRLAGRDRVIMRLRNNFAPYMKDTDHWDVFNLLTSGKEGEISNFNEIYSQVQDVEKFRSFMSDYVSRLKFGEIKTEKSVTEPANAGNNQAAPPAPPPLPAP
ncbi:MAG: hypothetical protein AB7U85_01455 [Alphaproteobacteria bacterium]